MRQMSDEKLMRISAWFQLTLILVVFISLLCYNLWRIWTTPVESEISFERALTFDVSATS